ncbi:MAG TPA: hypothetical protein VM095_21290 [Pyrinomonadaceae bacterium]|nr:hypothetical protein [Pyrinomonadaceae bacterium]
MKLSAHWCKLENLASIIKQYRGSVSVLLIVALSLTSMNRVYSVSEQIRAVPYDGVTLYRGLFFASGPVALKIPTLRKTAKYFPADYKNMEPRLIKYIQDKDPNFFNNFAKEIQSGDRMRVARAIIATNKLQRQAVMDLTRDSKSKFALQTRQMASRSADPEPDQDHDIAVAVLTAVAVFVLILVALVLVAEPTAELKGLKFEQYVNEIVSVMPRARFDVVKPEAARP